MARSYVNNTTSPAFSGTGSITLLVRVQPGYTPVDALLATFGAFDIYTRVEGDVEVVCNTDTTPLVLLGAPLVAGKDQYITVSGGSGAISVSVYVDGQTFDTDTQTGNLVDNEVTGIYFVPGIRVRGFTAGLTTLGSSAVASHVEACRLAAQGLTSLGASTYLFTAKTLSDDVSIWSSSVETLDLTLGGTGNINVGATVQLGFDVSIDNPGAMNIDPSTPIVLTLTSPSLGTKTWSVVDADGAAGLSVHPTTGAVSWTSAETPQTFNFIFGLSTEYGSDTQTVPVTVQLSTFTAAYLESGVTHVHRTDTNQGFAGADSMSVGASFRPLYPGITTGSRVLVATGNGGGTGGYGLQLNYDYAGGRAQIRGWYVHNDPTGTLTYTDYYRLPTLLADYTAMLTVEASGDMYLYCNGEEVNRKTPADTNYKPFVDHQVGVGGLPSASQGTQHMYLYGAATRNAYTTPEEALTWHNACVDAVNGIASWPTATVDLWQANDMTTFADVWPSAVGSGNNLTKAGGSTGTKQVDLPQDWFVWPTTPYQALKLSSSSSILDITTGALAPTGPFTVACKIRIPAGLTGGTKTILASGRGTGTGGFELYLFPNADNITVYASVADGAGTIRTGSSNIFKTAMGRDVTFGVSYYETRGDVFVYGARAAFTQAGTSGYTAWSGGPGNHIGGRDNEAQYAADVPIIGVSFSNVATSLADIAQWNRDCLASPDGIVALPSATHLWVGNDLADPIGTTWTDRIASVVATKVGTGTQETVTLTPSNR